MKPEIKKIIYNILFYSWILGIFYLIFQGEKWIWIIGIAFVSHLILKYSRGFLLGTRNGFALFLLMLILLATGYLIRPIKPYHSLDSIVRDLENFGFAKRAWNRTIETKSKAETASQTIQETFDESGVNNAYRGGNADWENATPVSLEWEEIKKPIFSILPKVKTLSSDHDRIIRDTVDSSFIDGRIKIVTSESRASALREASLSMQGITKANKSSIGQMDTADFILKIVVDQAKQEKGFRMNISLTNSQTAGVILQKQAFCEDVACLKRYIRNFSNLYDL